MADARIEAADDLLRRLDPQAAASNLGALCVLLPEREAVLRALVDVPPAVRACPASGRAYLCGAANACGAGCFRSPWSDIIYDAEGREVPEADAGNDARRRDGETAAVEAALNDALATYCGQYYDGGAVSSAYVWRAGSARSLAGAVLVQRVLADSGQNSGDASSWDACHVVEAGASPDGATWTYRLTTSVLVRVASDEPGLDGHALCASVSRVSESAVRRLGECTPADHVAAIGALVEDAESRVRAAVHDVHAGRAADTVNGLRPVLPPGYLRHQGDLAREMAERLALRSRAA